jgi:exopolyphosphatase/guanosine-5'-triphosphate,3'-diphosphate pyrophosphatase
VSDVVAAIDCGTNSLRLLVARVVGDRLIDVDRRMLVVRLGEGVDRTGEISPAALERAFAGCEQYRRIIDARGVERLRLVATSASRDARNADVFTGGVRRILGVTPEVITGAEEAELSFLGATRGVPHRRPVLVFDIGGGSTEFVLGDDTPQQATSVDMGCVRFHERYLPGDPPAPDELRAADAAAAALLDDVAGVVDLTAAHDVIGTAGTVTTVAAIALGLPEYDAARIHGARITTDDVTAVADRLAAMTVAQRLALPVMHPGRADVIASGALLMAAILHRIGTPDLISSEHDILDGIAWSLVT